MASSAHHERSIREEAAMAAITFHTAHPKEKVREQLKNILAAFRETLDAFASNRMRRAAAEAEYAGAGHIPEIRSPSTNPR
jgi:hypothetical protein